MDRDYKFKIVCGTDCKTVMFQHPQTGMSIVIPERLKYQMENTEISSITRKRAKVLYKILEKDLFKCVRCGETLCLTIDHYRGVERRPISGKKKYSSADCYPINDCVVLCAWCHRAKNDATTPRKKKEEPK